MSLPRTAGLLLVIIYLGFVSLGLPDGTLGVAWPAVYPELGLPVGLAGALMFVGTLMTATAGFSSGWLIAKFRTGPVLLVSCLLTSGAMLLLSQAHGAALLFGAAIPLGLGGGGMQTRFVQVNPLGQPRPFGHVGRQTCTPAIPSRLATSTHRARRAQSLSLVHA